jgi:hypothetical protein
MDVYIKFQEKFKMDLYHEIAYCSPPYGPFVLVSREKCHFCDEPVSAIGDSSLAQYAAGHFWGYGRKKNGKVLIINYINRIM